MIAAGVDSARVRISTVVLGLVNSVATPVPISGIKPAFKPEVRGTRPETKGINSLSWDVGCRR